MSKKKKYFSIAICSFIAIGGTFVVFPGQKRSSIPIPMKAR
ncbi:hypothetical protein [Paenisporosarcina antarctica]|nr:hypothetical protein [Paenisporosarcina antarctica]